VIDPKRGADGRVLGRGFAAALDGQTVNPRLTRRKRLDKLVGAVGRAVGDDDDLGLVGRVVERE
jgi:hypothetical protein